MSTTESQNYAANQASPLQTGGIVSDGSGFLQGVQPSTASVAAQQPVQQQPPVQPQPQQRMFTEEELEAARRQEKDKLYPRIEEMGNQLKALQDERDAERAERERIANEAETARVAKEEEAMDLRQLMERRDQEFRSALEERDRRYDADRAIFDQERRLQELTEYRRARLEQEGEFIIPELREFVVGNSPDEVDASIEALKERTASIVANFAAQAPPPQPFRGTAMPSVPPVGPMEQLPSYETLRPADIAGMSMDDYKRHRDTLLRAASQQRRLG